LPVSPQNPTIELHPLLFQLIFGFSALFLKIPFIVMNAEFFYGKRIIATKPILSEAQLNAGVSLCLVLVTLV
jgi:hypothetical protein